MKYFLDTEFIEYPGTIDIISIGIVSEDGKGLYLINQDFDESKASQWVKDNVIAKLPRRTGFLQYTPWVPKGFMKDEILRFIGDDKKPEFWGYYADYDWVVFCWLFGSMMELPKGWPKFCRDLRQSLDLFGNPTLPKQESGAHNAFEDALHLKLCFEFVTNQRELINKEIQDCIQIINDGRLHTGDNFYKGESIMKTDDLYRIRELLKKLSKSIGG